MVAATQPGVAVQAAEGAEEDVEAIYHRQCFVPLEYHERENRINIVFL